MGVSTGPFLKIHKNEEAQKLRTYILGRKSVSVSEKTHVLIFRMFWASANDNDNDYGFMKLFIAAWLDFLFYETRISPTSALIY